MLNGVPINPTTSYRVTANVFLAEGGDGFTVFKSGTDRLTGDIDLDALVAYLGANSSAVSPLGPPPSTRIGITGTNCPP